MKARLFGFLLTAFFLIQLDLQEAVASDILADNYFGRFKTYVCGYVDGKWLPGERKGNSFESFKQLASRYRNTAKKHRNNRRLSAQFTKLARNFDKKNSNAQKGCRKLATPTPAIATTLNKLPSIDSIVSENLTASVVGVSSVEGTPPNLVNIPDLGASSVFWNAGVINAIIGNSATREQCEQFFSSSTDGQSAGYGGCFMSQSVTETLGTAINSGTTLCYMKNAPTQPNLEAGAVSLIEGVLPDGGITALFAPPTGVTSRVVGLKSIGEGAESTIKPSSDNYFAYIRVYSTGELASGGNRYAYDFWSCANGTPDEIEQGRLSDSGVYTSHSYSSGEHNGDLLLTAHVLIGSNGEISFDSTQERTLLGSFSGPEGSHKLSATIRGDNTLFSKFYNIHGSETQYGASAASFSGSRFSTLKFLSGAFNDRFLRNGVLQNANFAAMEYRNTNYVAAPGLAALSTVAAVNLDSDPFFTAPTPAGLPEGYSCVLTPDIGVLMDMTNPAFLAVRSTCEGDRRDNLSFCWNDPSLGEAQMSYFTTCSQ